MGVYSKSYIIVGKSRYYYQTKVHLAARSEDGPYQKRAMGILAIINNSPKDKGEVLVG